MVRYALSLVLIGMAATTAFAQENWPQWRGPDQNNIAPTADPPLTWSETENIVWKTPLPSWSGSSPIVWGDKVYLMSPSKPDGSKEQQDSGGMAIVLLCLDKATGKVLWEREIAVGNKLYNKQNNSSPTPVTDGKHIWVYTGSGILAGLDMDGNVLWRKNIPELYGRFVMQFNNAVSPVLYKGTIFIQVLHGYFDEKVPSYIDAFDGLTGEVRWHHVRPTTAILEARDSYNTPLFLNVNGKDQLIVSGGDCVTGHDPETGSEIWRAWGLNPTNYKYNRIIASAAAADGMVYAPSRVKPLLAVRADGTGDVTATHTAWKWEKPGGPDVPTPICDGKYFYMMDDSGKATCLDAKTGAVIWGPEKAGSGIHSASPLLAGNRIYFTNEESETIVIAAGPHYKHLAANKLSAEGGKTLSSFAVSNNQLFLRTATHLYCIGKPAK